MENRPIMSQAQQLKRITLQGSATIVADFFKYAVSSILYHRDVFKKNAFKMTKYYGTTLFLINDNDMCSLVDSTIPSIEEWLGKGQLISLSLVIISVDSGVNLEKWDFDIKMTANQREHGKKSIREIQKEIRYIMKQIGGTVTYMPILEGQQLTCKLMADVTQSAIVPEGWEQAKDDITILNPERAELKHFSTSIHTVNVAVTYKSDSEEDD